MTGQRAFCFGRAGADDATAELFGNLNCGRADAAHAADGEDPITLMNGSAIGEHVHGGAAGESQGGCGVEIDACREADESASRDENFFGEPAIAIDTQELAEEAEGFVAAPAEFAFATEEIGLDGDFVSRTPILHVAAERQDTTCNFPAERARELNGYGQAGGFGPEINVIEAAALNLNDSFVWAGYGIRDIA